MPAERTLDRSESQAPPLARRVEPEANGLAPTVEVPISAIIDRHAASMTPEGLEKLVALFNQQEDRAAAREFSAAMAAFQAECPPIRKASTAEIVTTSGARYSYQYAELDMIANTIRPLLHKHGLSYTWDSSEAGGLLACTCTIRHANGHSVASKFTCSIDSAAKMSGAQKSGAALTYAKRQALIQALGLTTGEPDTDGAASRHAETGPTITEDQAANLDAMLDELKAKDPHIKARFLRHLKAEKLGDILASRFKGCVEMLEAKRAEQGGKA